MTNQRRTPPVRLTLLVLSLAAAGCHNGARRPAAPTAHSPRCPSGLTVGFLGALSGDNPAVAANQGDGVQLAADQHNATHHDCPAAYKAFDTGGDPTRAAGLARTIVGDPAVLAVVGPTQTVETEQAEPVLNSGGVPTITASATDPSLAANGWKVFHRAVGNDNAQAPGIARFIINTLKAHKAAVVDDGTAYGEGLANIVRQQLGAAGVTVDSPASIDKSHKYPATVKELKAANVDVVFFAGSYPEAGALALQLKDGGVSASFMSDDRSLDPAFVQVATPAGAEGAYLSASVAHTLTRPQDQAFVAGYRAKFGTAPGPGSVEAYDATNHILAAVAAGNYTRADINTYLTTVAYQGLIRRYAYNTTGELQNPEIVIHKIVNGEITLIGPA